MYLLSPIILSALAAITLATHISTRDTQPFTDAALTITTFASKDCQKPTNSMATQVSYGINYHAAAASFSLSRNLAADEQLDFSTTGQPGSSGVDAECTAFQYTASPNKGNGSQPLSAGCYDTPVPAGVSFLCWWLRIVGLTRACRANACL